MAHSGASDVYRLRRLFLRCTSQSSPTGTLSETIVSGKDSDHTQFAHLTDVYERSAHRRRDRLRRPHRLSRRTRPEYNLATVNVRRWTWNTSNMLDRTRQIIKETRATNWEITCLTEMAPTEKLTVVYIEEFCLITQGKVGVLLGPVARRAWGSTRGKASIWTIAR